MNKSEFADANLDYLTKLPNRQALYSRFDALPDTTTYHFMFLDLDNFKIVNDVYGHSAGDDLLVVVANTICTNVPEGELFRIGGDEFVMILSGESDRKQVTQICSRILNSMHQVDFRQDIMTTITLSIGVILNQDKESSLDDVLYKCDSAMYRAKKDGKNRCVIYSAAEPALVYRRTIESEMHQALERGEFELWLQPKINMSTSNLYGAEALVRWNHPKDGMRFPDDFLPVFETNGFIIEIDMFIFEQVCKLKQQLREEPCGHLIISINFSRLHFYKPNFVPQLVAIANQYGVNTNELEIEITENIFTKNLNTILDKVNQLKKEGFFISIDDFGAGYSSLNVLKDIPADILKMDKEFLRMSTDNERGKAVIRNIIMMGKDLKLQVIAEGVETLEQMLFLTSCGCELAQGFFYSKPMREDKYVKYAEEHLVVNERVYHFPFKKDFSSDMEICEGTPVGTGVSLGAGMTDTIGSIIFEGGEIEQNVLLLPPAIMCKESYTISFWINPEKITSWASAVYIQFDNGFLSFVPLGWEGSAVFRIREARIVGGWFDTGCSALQENEWRMITLTYDNRAEVSRIYDNGEQVGFKENTPQLRVCKKIIIGGDVYKPSFKGKITDLKIYDYAKGTQEIRQMYLDNIRSPEFKLSNQT